MKLDEPDTFAYLILMGLNIFGIKISKNIMSESEMLLSSTEHKASSSQTSMLAKWEPCVHVKSHPNFLACKLPE